MGALAGENFSGRNDLGSLMLTSAGYILLLSEIFQEWTFLEGEIWLMLLLGVLYIYEIIGEPRPQELAEA